MNKALTHGLTMFVLTAASAFAGQAINATIPFTFHVGNKILPSGSYTADMNISSRVLRLTSADGKSSAMALSQDLSSSAGSQKPKFVFTRYGNDYFLREVWTNGMNGGQGLPSSKLEREIAKAVDRNRTTLVAAGR